MVLEADAGVDPRTMVVKPCHTSVTRRAVLRTQGTPYLAREMIRGMIGR